MVIYEDVIDRSKKLTSKEIEELTAQIKWERNQELMQEYREESLVGNEE